MTPAFRQAIKGKKFKDIPYHTKEKAMIPLSISILLWLLTALHHEINWQIIMLWIVALYVTIRYWSWKLALLLLVLSLGTQNEILWIKYYSMGAFYALLFLSSMLSSHVSSYSSFSVESQSFQDEEEEEYEEIESDLWTE
jgi:hypothetical protein